MDGPFVQRDGDFLLGSKVPRICFFQRLLDLG